VVVVVTVVVVSKSPVVVAVIVVVAGTVMVLDTTTVTTDVEVVGMALLSVTVTTSVNPGSDMVRVAVLLTALMQEQADEYSSKLAQLDATGYNADVEDVTVGSAVEDVASGTNEEAEASGVDAVDRLDVVLLQPRFLGLRFFIVGSGPGVGAVTTSVTVVMRVDE
jgi:hypothetical protein